MERASRRDEPVVCASCGRKTARRMRGQRYCSAQCRERGRGRVRKAFLGRDTGAPATPHENANVSRGLQRHKSRSYPLANAARIIGPRIVLDTELPGLSSAA
jgi:hypothetical protein